MQTITFFGEVVGNEAMVSTRQCIHNWIHAALERRDDPGAMRLRRYGIIPQLEHRRKYPHLYHK